MATSFSGGRSRSIRRETPTMGKQLVNFIPCGCESSAPFFVIYKAGHDVKFEVSVDQAMRQMKLFLLFLLSHVLCDILFFNPKCNCQ